MVGALAWPVAIIVLALLVRSPLRRVLLSLTRLKYKEMEIDFGRELSRIEAEAKSIDLTPAPVPEPHGHGPKNSTEQLREAARLTDDFPEPAVALTGCRARVGSCGAGATGGGDSPRTGG